MSQNYVYPSSSDVTITGIGNPTGLPVPADAIYIAGKDPSGNLHGVAVDSAGDLIVSPLTNTSVVKAQLQDNNGAAVVLGQALMATSLPVAIASNQSAIPVSQSGTWNINNISGTISLPTGASTSALQSTISGQLPATLGQKASAASLAVVIASDQSTLPVSASALPLPSGAATSALQTTGNTSLASIVTNTTGASTSALQTTGNTSLATIATNTTGASTAANQTTGNTSLSTIATNTTRQGTLTDGSGSTSATPSTSTQIFAANSSRKYLLIQNLDSSNNIYINFTSAASNGTGSYTLLPYGVLAMESLYVSTQAVNVLATVASINFTAKQG